MFDDPARNMRLGRRLLAVSMGVPEDELPADIDVELSHDHTTGELRVVGRVIAKGVLSSYVTSRVSIGSPQSSEGG